MPIYEYECEQCGVRFERLQRMSEDSLQDCPECSGHVHRVMQPVGVIFKGSGFYVTDNRGKSSTGIPPAKHEDSKHEDSKHDESKHDESKQSGSGAVASPASSEKATTSASAAGATNSETSRSSKSE